MIAKVSTGFTTAGDVLIPGRSCRKYALQNNGTGTWRLAWGADTPTGTLGYLLAAGAEFIETLGVGDPMGPRCLRAIFNGDGTQALDIITDDKDSTAPAHA